MSFPKNKIVASGVLLILTTLAVGILTANASVGGPVGPDCTEMVNPFLLPPDGQYAVGDTSAYVNSSISESTCKTHAPYANLHISVDPAAHNATAAAINDKIHGPWTDHYHSFHNNSIQDSYIYKTYMAAFEITVESDGVSNTDSTEMECPVFAGQSGTILNNFKNCVDGAYDPSHYGGIHLSRKTVGSSIVLRWDFGWDTSGGKPWTSGKNPSVDIGDSPEIFPYNTSAPFDITYPFDPNEIRSFHMGIRLRSKDNISGATQAWSGTTTSRALVKDTALLLANKWNYNLTCNSGGWCALEPSNTNFYPSLPGTVGHPITSTGESALNYYWVPIGSVVTVWKRTTPPPPKDCTIVNINPTGPFSENDLPKDINITSSTTGGLTLDYKWTANNTGSFVSFDNVTYTGTPYIETGSLTTIDKEKALVGPITMTVVAVDSTDHTKEYPGVGNVCKKTITINPAPPGEDCTDLDITPAGPFSADDLPKTFTVTPTTTGGLTLDYKWTASNPGSVIKFDDTLTYTGTPYYDINTSTKVDKAVNPITSPVTVYVQGVKESDHSVEYNLCKAQVTINPPPPSGKCEALNPSISKQPVNPGESVYLNASPTYSGSLSPQFIHWKEEGNGYFSNAPGQPPICDLPLAVLLAPASATTEFTAPFTCAYYYTAGSAGDKVSFDALPDPTNEINCEKTYTVEPKTEEKPYCQDLLLQPSELESDGTTDLKATVVLGNSDGSPHEATLQWQGDGNFSNFSPAQSGINQQKGNVTTSLPFQTTFMANDPLQSEAQVKVVSIAGVSDISNCDDFRIYKKPPEEKNCKGITPYPLGNSTCLNVTGDYKGDFTWQYGSTTLTTKGCVDIPPDTSWSVYATAEPNNNLCKASGKTPKRPPTLEKLVSRAGKNNYKSIVSVATNETAVDYKLILTPTSPNTSAVIKDPIGSGIQGYTYGSEGQKLGGLIPFDDNMKIEEQGWGQLNACSSLPEGSKIEHCYNGVNPGYLELVKIDNPVTITYRGKINKVLNEEICRKGIICQEKFDNTATADYTVYDEDDKPVTSGQLRDEATVQLFCQYILTRAAGDIYLETDLNAGVDIRQCSKYRSTTGIVITPAPPEAPPLAKTGAGEIFTIGHEICTEGQTGSLPAGLSQFYGQDVVKNLSSLICEVKLQPGTAWRQSAITNSIEENKTRISRWEADWDVPNTNISIETLLSTAGDKNVYHVKNANLVIGDSGQDYVLADGEGAKTFIVEDGNLIIKKNIRYAPCNKIGDVCNVTDIASLAFIVLNGNVSIEPDVEEVSGVFFVQGDTAETGKLYAAGDQPSYKQIVFYGSVYGDIEPLFLNRLFAGDPALEEAGIVIRFDERVILNTPPGLRDVLSLSETEVAR